MMKWYTYYRIRVSLYILHIFQILHCVSTVDVDTCIGHCQDGGYMVDDGHVVDSISNDTCCPC